MKELAETLKWWGYWLNLAVTMPILAILLFGKWGFVISLLFWFVAIGKLGDRYHWSNKAKAKEEK